MKRIGLSLLSLALLAGRLLAADVTITIGETSFTIPAPAGFVPVTKDMATLDRALEAFVAPPNIRFVSFIPAEFQAAVQRGELPQMVRNMSVQTTKKIVSGTFTASDFADFKEVMRSETADMVKKVEKEMPGYIDEANRKINRQFNTDVAMKFGGMVPLPPHEETDRSLAFSMQMDLSMRDSSGGSVKAAGYVTGTFLFARAKIFFLYVNGGEQDLEWTRKTAHDWAAAILMANPSDAATAALESRRSSRGFNWGRAGRGALIGAAVGGLIGLFRLLGRKKG